MSKQIREWPVREPDSAFTGLKDFYKEARERRERCKEFKIPRWELELIASSKDLDSRPGAVQVDADGVVTTPTHWSFNQLSSLSQWRASDLRRLSPQLVKLNVEYGLKHLSPRRSVKVMYDTQSMTLRALTGPDFGRIWDYQVIEVVQNFIASSAWRAPALLPASTGSATCHYVNDRGSFMFLVNDEYRIEISEGVEDTETIYLGLFVTNSEVGSSSLALGPFLYRWLCSNRMVLEVLDLLPMRAIRHSKNAPKWFAARMGGWLNEFRDRARLEACLDDVTRRLRKTMTQVVPGDNQAVRRWLMRHRYSSRLADQILEAVPYQEGRDRTVWDLVQAGTVIAQEIPFSDHRVHLETQAGALVLSTTARRSLGVTPTA